jgi:hypothetical protein
VINKAVKTTVNIRSRRLICALIAIKSTSFVRETYHHIDQGLQDAA